MAYRFPSVGMDNKQLPNNKNKYIIWGAGKIGAITIKRMKQLNLNILAVCDKNPNRIGEIFNGYKIITPEDLKNYKGTVVIASRYFDEIAHKLIEMNRLDFLTCDVFFSGAEVDFADCVDNMHAILKIKEHLLKPVYKKDALILNSIDVVVTEKCSLKCKDCANLMQYYQNPQNEELELVLDSVKKIMQAADIVFELRVLGGEPFVNEEMYKYVNGISNYQNYSDIIVYTNGTIIPKGDNLNCLKKENLFLSISDYGVISIKLDKIRKLMNQEKILYDIKSIESWTDSGHIHITAKGESEAKKVFEECCCNKIFSIRRGKLFGCPFAGNASVLQAIPDYKQDYVNLVELEDIQEIKNQIKKLNESSFYEACRHCPGRPFSGNEIPPAKQAIKALEWRKND